MPLEQATAIIIDGRGAHFDPDVVDAFAQTAATFAEIAARYSDDADDETS